MVGLLVVLLIVQQTPEVVVDRDNVEITRDCRVVVGKEVIEDTDGNGVVLIVGNEITVDFAGAALRGSKADAASDSFKGVGVRITGKGVTLQGARIAGFKTGIWATKADGLTIEDCDVSGNFQQRLKSTPEAEDQGDWLWPHKNDENEWLWNYGAGIYVEESNGIAIRQNMAAHGQNGLCLRRVNDGEISYNDFSFLSGWGIAMYRSSKNKLACNHCDFCVRGYSHGVYSRGQDSAGILMFEQCCDNVLVYNSATHSGDGFFGFAGNEALDKSERPRTGNNRNTLYGNDFSWSPAIGIEMTFSFDNLFNCNTLCGGNYGIWGGYSSDTQASGNTIADNEIAGIAIEHGSNWTIAENKFERNRRAIELWWDEDKDLLAKPWAKLNNTASRDYWLFGNRIESGPVGIELRGGTTGVHSVAPRFVGVADPYKIDKSSEYTETKEYPTTQRIITEPPDSVPGLSRLAARKSLAGRDKIIITEWGPYDWKQPHLQRVEDQPGKHAYRLLGETALGASTATGEVDVSTKSESGLSQVVVSGRTRDALTPYELVVTAGGKTFRRSGVICNANWQVRMFAYKTDPRQDADAWRSEAESGVTFTTDRLNFRFANGGPSKLAKVDEKVAKAGLPADSFGVLAEARLTIPAGRWKLTTTSDDGVRVYVDDERVIDNWTHHVPTVDTADLQCATPRDVRLRVEYFELTGFAVLALDIQRAE